MGSLGLLPIYAIGLLAAVLAAAKAHDDLFAAHAWIFAIASLLAIIFTARRAEYAGEVDTGPQTYMDGVVRAGVIATVFWGIAGFLVGVIIAAQLAFPVLNLDWSFTNFGRLRPLHTSAVIFAFGGNALICTSFYIVQRTCRARLALGNTAWFVFWG